MTIPKLKDKVGKVFSEYIRRKYSRGDDTCVCYTCGKVMQGNQKGCQAGHGFGGRTNMIIFDEKIVRPQCFQCNIRMHGNYDVFHAKLEQEYGYGIIQKYNKLKYQDKSFTREELYKIMDHYKEEIGILKNKNLTTDV